MNLNVAPSTARIRQRVGLSNLEQWPRADKRGTTVSMLVVELPAHFVRERLDEHPLTHQ
jgi:hypothetical protein